jgi:release factor glutamine methyltransferase
MLSLLEVLDRTTSYFADAGVPNARLQAEWILAHAMGCGRLDLYVRFDMPLPEDVLARIRPLVRRRARREPLQYVLGSTPFHDLKLACDARALIPRPETEELVEMLVEKLLPPPASVLDLGTGSGAIALALAKAWPGAKVDAVDYSEEALDLARANAASNGLAERVAFTRSDWFSNVRGTYDLIVSNPPYLTHEEWESAQPEVRDFEPLSALVAQDEGMADIERILREATYHMNAGATIAIETGIAQHPALIALAGSLGFAQARSLADSSGRPRFIFASAPVRSAR